MNKETKTAANTWKKIWILAAFAVLVVVLTALYIGSRPPVGNTESVSAPTPNPTMLAEDYQKALKNIDEGNLRMALVRFEYILAYSKDFPDAEEKLASIRAILYAVPTGPAGSQVIPTVAAVQAIEAGSMMADTATPLPTDKPTKPPIPTQIVFTYPEVTATPLSLNMNDPDTVNKYFNKHHPGLCSSGNLITNQNPNFPPVTPVVKITEIESFPDAKTYFLPELADNSDGTLRAVIACLEDSCVDRVYVKDLRTGRAYVVDIGTVPQRPLQWLAWLNRDVFLVFQSYNPHTGMVAAIDFTHQKFVHYGYAFETGCPPKTTEEP